MSITVRKRYLELDFIRGMAIVLMVIFHLSFDLNYYGLIDIDIYNGAFWKYFRDFIIFLFMISVGISLYIVNEKSLNLPKNLMRLFKLFMVALLISVVSFFIYPTSWIYFGIIHLIFVSSIFALAFVRVPQVALGLGLVIITLYFCCDINMDWLYDLSATFLSLPPVTQDIGHLFPWLGVVYLGIYIGYKKWFDWGMVSNVVTEKVAFLGRHALVIYLLHQPLMMGGLYILVHYL